MLLLLSDGFGGFLFVHMLIIYVATNTRNEVWDMVVVHEAEAPIQATVRSLIYRHGNDLAGSMAGVPVGLSDTEVSGRRQCRQVSTLQLRMWRHSSARRTCS